MPPRFCMHLGKDIHPEYVKRNPLVRRRKSVCSAMHPSPELRPAAAQPLTETQETLAKRSLRRLFIFNDLSDKGLKQVMRSFIPKEYPANAIIVHEGDDATENGSFYLIESGTVEYINNGRVIGTSGPGSYFCELALLHDAPRAATVRATSPLKLWALDRFTFKSIMKETLTKKREHSREVIAGIDFMRTLDSSAQYKLADALDPISFNAGELVIKEGALADYFYIIDKGEADYSANGKKVSHLKTGDFFGELALLYDSPYKATVTALTALKTERLSKEGFEQLLGPQVVKELRERSQKRLQDIAG